MIEEMPTIYQYEDGHLEYFLNGKELTKDWFLKHPDKINELRAWDLFEPEELVRLCLNTKK